MRPADLPDTLRERTRALTDGPVEGEFVLVWMRGALRAWENPCLDAALAAADALGLPVFVYRGLSERYPYASDRHHTFLLEGHRDVARHLADRGLGTALHVERDGHRGDHLRTLARRAALVLTEDVPVEPVRGWTERLAGTVDTPVWLVDTACVVPMNIVGRAYDRAFRFRDATAADREGRLRLPWTDHEVRRSPFVPDLPFEPVDLDLTPIPDLVAACDIDHTIGPVPHTRGGSSHGYARWQAFVRDGGLKRYHRSRNDALADGVSRMSAYLHHGMVAPTRIAREAAEHGGKGADKYLDELLIWRELSWCWCRFRRAHDTLDALPGWARETLAAHAGDPRHVLDRETLARGRTGEPLWDAAQRSLLQHGELHNNVRMTWGKAILRWTDGPAEALATLIDLNHRYALDGRDPNSYTGLLWCLGGFDRPFKPPQPVLGTVRPRPVGSHARRLDVDAYARHVARPLRADPPLTAVVGGGLAGALCARTLADHGYPVVVLDKGRGPGGRTSTRRADADRFDHGAPCFGPVSPPLIRSLDAWLDAGVVARWRGPFVRLTDDGATPLDPGPRFVGQPSMNALLKHLLADVDARFGARVTRIRNGDGLRLDLEDGTVQRVDRVVVATPAPQAVPLLAEVAPDLAAHLEAVEVAPAWVGMVTLPTLPDLGWGLAHLPDDDVLQMIVVEASKPGRRPGGRLVLHATEAWTRAHLEDDRDDVARALLAAAARHLDLPEAVHLAAHRWRYSRVTRPVGAPFLLDASARVGVCGDALPGRDLPGALDSGAALAGRLLSAFADEVAAPTPEVAVRTPQLALL